MHENPMDELLSGLRDEYNSPPETPREEMWSAIQARLASGNGKEVSLSEARRHRMARYRRPLGWAGAAAALLVLGLGIGRITAPAAGPGETVAVQAEPDPGVLRVAAVQHLARSESLLTLVRADARAGRLEPTVGPWARTLLSQTRLLMDAQGVSDPVMEELLEDLELVLVQIVGVTGAANGDPDVVRSELNLALGGLEEREVLPRIQAVIPAGARFVGT